MYSLKDLSTMTMLSDRTLRNYLDAGILQGRKENGAWVFTSEQIELFLQNDMVKSAIRTKKNAIVKDFIVNSKKKGNSVCLIWDLPDADPSQVGRFICDAAGKRDDVLMSFENAGKKNRIILSGSETAVYEIMTEFRRQFPSVPS